MEAASSHEVVWDVPVHGQNGFGNEGRLDGWTILTSGCADKPAGGRGADGRADGWTSGRPDERVAAVWTKGRLYKEHTNDSHGPQSNLYADAR